MRAMSNMQKPSALSIGFAGVILIYLIAPILLIAPLSLSSSQYLRFPPPGWSTQWYREFFTTPAWIESLWNSLLISLIAAAIATVIGSAAAFGLARGTFPLRNALLAFFLSPMIVPPVVLAISLYGLYVHLGVIGGRTGIIIGHIVYVTPLVIITVISSLLRFDDIYERASLSLGAGRVRTALLVTIPNIWTGLFSAFLLAFVSSFDELVIAMFVGGSTMTLPRKMWEDLVVIAEPTQAAASVVLVAVSLLAFAVWLLIERQARRHPLEVSR
jgi:putative spermidine/putrescine transport system permease protein